LRDGGSIRCRVSEFAAFVEVFVLRDYDVPGLNWTSLKTIVDVGANVGFASIWFARRAPHARIVAIEPSATALSLLKPNLASAGILSRTVLLPVGLGSSPGLQHLVEGDASVGTRTVRRSDPAGSPGPSVPVTTLAQVCEEQQLHPLDLLKLDCEGAEFEILMTMEPSALKEIGTIVGEFHRIDGHDPLSLGAYLEAHDLSVVMQDHPRDPLLGTFVARKHMNSSSSPA
jgi:FkbM family methyltransferase